MKKIVGVMGPGAKDAAEESLKDAYEVGRMVAELGATLLCGGMTGVMEESARGARDAGGLTVGIGPVDAKTEMNPYIDVPLVTNMGPGRNYMNIISSDVLVFVTVGSPGTLSELAYAIQARKPSAVVGASGAVRTLVQELGGDTVSFIETLVELREWLAKSLK